MSSGFTFVELIIAATMMSVLFVGLGTHLKGGVIVWQRATRVADTLQRERVAWDRLQRDLANAVVFDAREDVYGGAEGQLPLPAFGRSSLAWFTLESVNSNRGTGGRPTSTVRFVTYACTEEQGVAGLWRTSQSVGQARAKRAEPSPELILAGCEELAVRYAYLSPEPSKPLEWSGEWKDAYKELPRLLRVSLSVTSKPLERTLSIPTGVLKTKSPST